MIELIVVLLIGLGILYATFATHPMSLDDLMELKFLPSRRNREPGPTHDQIIPLIMPRGRCLHAGQVNNPWTSQHCTCRRFRFKQYYFGVALCECGDVYQEHAPINANHDRPEGSEGGAAVNDVV